MTKKYFGTDGIRGKAGEYPITPDFVMRLGYAAGKVLTSVSGNLAKGAHPAVLIGKDTRISGYMLEAALEAGLSAAGVDVLLTGPMPTPAVAYLTRALRAQAGIVISASHNPYYDNGIKFFSSEGAKLGDDIEHAIEAELDKPMQVMESAMLGKARRIDDAAGRYIEFCKSTFPNDMDLRGLKIVLDCAHGATYHVAPNVFHELGAEIISIGNKPDGLNINELVGSTHPQALQKVAGTLMTNLALEHALQNNNIPFARAKVGDRYVLELLNEKKWLLGGENSGHILTLDKHSSGDAIIAALQVLHALILSGKTLADLRADLVLYPQVLINVVTAKKVDLDRHDQIQAAVKTAEKELAGRGRVLLRASGTEPKIRVMVEGEDGVLVQKLAEDITIAVKIATGT